MATKQQIIKQAKELLQQNTYFEDKCPFCKKTIKIKTKELFSGKDDFVFTCNHCKNEIAFTDLTNTLYDFGKQLTKSLKDININIKIKM